MKRQEEPPQDTPWHPFDRAHGTDTGGLIQGHALATGHANDVHVTAYYAVAPSILESLIDVWMTTRPRFDIEAYTFLDVGAGKGRAILTAAQHPFARVVGVELNPHLAEIAQANIAAFARSSSARLLSPVTILQGDALEVPLPTTPTLVFLFHPFEAVILRRFAERLEAHFANQPGAFDIIYVNAEHRSVLDRRAWLTRVFYGLIPMSAEDHRADRAEIATQTDYGSTGDELCTIHRFGIGERLPNAKSGR